MDTPINNLDEFTNRMDWFEQTVERLTRHFDKVRVRQPAKTNYIVDLQAEYVVVPEQLVRFYTACDGIYVFTEDYEDGLLLSLQKSMGYMPVGNEQGPLGCLLPIHTDGCGNFDCVVLGNGIGAGAVVFWDHELQDRPAYLLGGTLAGYFAMWADRLISRYLPNGELERRNKSQRNTSSLFSTAAGLSHPWPFDEHWIRTRDKRADELLDSSKVREWLLLQDEISK